MILQSFTSHCPYCGEHIEIDLDCSGGSQFYYEDCQVCCRPMVISVEVDDSGELFNCTIKREDD